MQISKSTAILLCSIVALNLFLNAPKIQNSAKKLVRQMDLFARLDTGSDGSISLDELEQSNMSFSVRAVTGENRLLNKNAASVMFVQNFDKDDDGKISRWEFLSR